MMKKNVIAAILLACFSTLAMAQEGRVGINTVDPKTTMDVRGKTDASGVSISTDATGLQAPRLTRAELTAKGNSLYGTDQKGALVYITDTSAGDTLSQRINVTSIGYYYFDGALWQLSAGSAASIEPWNLATTTNKATANTDNIYQKGKVAVGADNTLIPTKQLEVIGDFKAKYSVGTTYFSAIESNNTDFGVPMNMSYVADKSDLTTATELSMVNLRSGVATLQSNNGTSGANIGAFSTTTGGTAGFSANDATGLITSSIWGYANNFQNFVTISHNKSSSDAANIVIEKQKGVTFSYAKTNGSSEGAYTFPRTNGTTDQVLVTDGVAAGAQLTWKNISAIASEPWNIIGSSPAAPATANSQRIYQTGAVAIGASTIPTFTAGSATINPMLHVAGDISTTGKVWTTNSVYADYVFEKYFAGRSVVNPDYEFKSLNYVKDFIKTNNHLPGVTSIADLAKANMGYTFDMTKLAIQSLEKIEELYLHTIEQQDKIDKQQIELDALKNTSKETAERLKILEKSILKSGR